MDDAAPRSGVTEVSASYGEALRLIGTQDPNGNHIGIVNVPSHALRLIAFGLRTVRLLVVLSLKVREEVATLKAKVQKAMALRESKDALERDLDLRIARIKRAFLERLIPEQIQVLGVEGVGAGFGLSLGNRLLKEITRTPLPEDEKAS